EFDRLILKKCVDVGIIAVDVRASLDHESLKTGSGVAEGTAAPLNEVLVALLRVSLEESRPLERSELRVNAHCLEVVEHGLGKVRVRGVAVVLAGVEAIRVTSVCQQLSGLGRIVYWGRRLPIVFEAVRDDAAGKLGVAKRQCLVDGLAVDGQAGRESHPLVVPWRLRVPLVGEIEPLRARGVYRLEGEPLGALQLLGQFTADRVDNVDIAPLERSQPRGLVGDRPEYQALDARGLAPILIEGLEGQ